MIFETLYLLFKADTDDLQKNTKKATGLTDELKKSFKNLGDVSGLLDDSFLKLTSSIGGLIAAGISAHAVYDGFKTSFDFSTTLAMNARELGVNVTELQKWGQALQEYGGNAETFKSTIAGISEKTGLSPENSIHLLSQLGDTVAKYNTSQRRQFGETWGIDQATVQLLANGNAELEKKLQLQVKLGLITQTEGDAFLGLNKSLIDTKNSLNYLFTEMAVQSLPTLKKMLETLTEFFTYVSHNHGAVEGAFKGLTVVVIALSAAFLLLNPTVLVIGALSTAVIALSAYIGTIPESAMEKKLGLSEGTLHKYATFSGYLESILYTIKAIGELWDKFKDSKFGAGAKLIDTAFSFQKSLTNGDLESPINTATNNVVSNANSHISSMVTNNSSAIKFGDINVNGSGQQDAKGTARTIANTLDGMIGPSLSAWQNQIASGTR